MARHHGKEYFPESVYGRASPRVIADGEAVPKGGGQYLVGNAYTVAGKTYVPSEKKYRRGRPRLLVWRRLPRPPHRQWRSL